MASKKELIASARRKGSKQQIFRRGRGTTTSVQRPSADPSAGSEAKAVSAFLGKMIQFGPGVVDAHNRETNEENKKLVASGQAAYKNANVSQRKEFRDNIRNGTISGGESPYFREGLQRAHADSMSLKYGVELMDSWNKSEAKNDPNPEAFQNFLDEHDQRWSGQLGNINEHVALEEFHPKADALKRQLMQTHSSHQRIEYDKKAQDQKQTAEFDKLNNNSLETALGDPLIDRLLSEEVQNDALTAHVNMLNETKNRMTRKGNLKSRFISNAYSKGMSKKDALVAWNTEKNNLGITVNNLSLESIGQPSEGVFRLAQVKAEEKEAQKDIAKPYKKGEGGDTAPTFKAVADVGFTPTLIPMTPIEEAETEEVGLASLWEPVSPPPSDSDSQIHSRTESPQMWISQGPEMNENLKKALRATPSKSINVPQPKVESDKQVDQSIMTALHKELGSKQKDEGKILTRAKGKEWAERDVALAKGELTAEDQVAAAGIDASVPQPMQPSVETPIDLAVKTFEGVSPDRTHYGVVAYNSKDEADLMVEKIREGIVGDTTGTWEFATVKVGNLYQVQTQGNVNVTDEQKAAFFNKLASEYPGEMGNLKAGNKDKDFVQIIPPKKYKKKKKKGK